MNGQRIYFGLHRNGKILKVGMSDNPEFRLGQVWYRQKQHRFKMIGSIPHSVRLEGDILRYFRPFKAVDGHAREFVHYAPCVAAAVDRFIKVQTPKRILAFIAKRKRLTSSEALTFIKVQCQALGWPALAALIGVEKHVVYAWWRRGTVPEWRLDAVERAARRVKLPKPKRRAA